MAKGVKTGGRKAGTPNKTTGALKDAILNAFERAGGENFLVTLAQTDPKTFVSLLSRVLPLTLTGEGGGPIQMSVAIDRPTRESRDEWIARRNRELAAVGSSAGPTN